MTARAGMAHSRIDLPAGLPMDGYGARQSAAAGTRDPLEATALYVADEHRAVVVVGLDVIAVGAPLVQWLRSCIGQEVDVVATLVAATHTHAGPAGVRDTDHDDDVTQPIVDAVRDCVRRAAATAAPARADVGTGWLPASVATNRNDPGAAIDRRLTLVRLTRLDERPIGLLWHTGVHPTVLGPENLYFSADLPGEVRRRLRHDDETVMFLNGPAGDVSSRFVRRGRDGAELERLGGLLCDALPPTDRPIRLDPVADAGRTETLDPGRVPHEQSDRLRRRTRRELAAEGLTTGERRRLESVLEGLARRDGHPSNAPVEAEVQTLRLGDLVLAAVPGEPVSALSSSRAVHADAVTLLVGYANGYIGYLTTASDEPSDEPTYETLVSRVDADAGARLMAVTDELVKVTGVG